MAQGINIGDLGVFSGRIDKNVKVLRVDEKYVTYLLIDENKKKYIYLEDFKKKFTPNSQIQVSKIKETPKEVKLEKIPSILVKEKASKPLYTIVGIITDKNTGNIQETEDLQKSGIKGYRIRYNKSPDMYFGYIGFDLNELDKAKKQLDYFNEKAEKEKELKKVKDAENKIKREENKIIEKTKLEAANKEIIKKPSYLMTLSEYQEKVLPILTEYQKFLRKNSQYFESSDFDGIYQYTYPELEEDFNNNTIKGWKFQPRQYRENPLADFKASHYPDDEIVETNKSFVNKLKNFFTDKEIYSLISKDEFKSNKASIKRAIDNDTYKKLLESGELSESELETIAKSVDVKVPKKVFSVENVKAKEMKAKFQKLLSDLPLINQEQLDKLIESIKIDFKPLEEEVFTTEKARYIEKFKNLVNEEKVYETKLNNIIRIWPELFTYDKRGYDEIKTGRYYSRFHKEEIIERDYYLTGLKLKSDWESTFDKFLNDYVDTLKYSFIDAIIKNFTRITKPIKEFEKLRINLGEKGFEGVYRFTFDDGSYFDFKAEAIRAGGYNIQVLHLRYITNFENITLNDGSKVKGYASLIENFNVKRMEKGGVIDTLNPTGSVFVNYTAKEIDKLPLGKNITTYDITAELEPDEKVIVYRGVPSHVTEIISGDFVTTNKQLAKDYAGNGKVLSKEVRADEILDDITEPLGEEYILRLKNKMEKGGETNQKWYRKYNGSDALAYNKETRAKYGNGIYFSSQPNSRFDGEKEIEVIVDYKNPKIYENTKTIPNRNFIKDWRKEHDEDEMNKFVDSLFDSGYDAIIVKHSDTFGDELIVRDKSLIKYENGGLTHDDMKNKTDKYKNVLKRPSSLLKISQMHQVPVPFLQIQLKKGMKVESEHTNRDVVAKIIALHHLEEDPRYYIKLEKMEGQKMTDVGVTKPRLDCVCTKTIKFTNGLNYFEKFTYGCTETPNGNSVSVSYEDGRFTTMSKEIFNKHFEYVNKMADGGGINFGEDLGGGFSIGNDVYITDSKSLFQGKTGFVSGLLGKDLLVTISEQGNERNVVVSKKGVEKLDAPEYAYGGRTFDEKEMEYQNQQRELMDLVDEMYNAQRNIAYASDVDEAIQKFYDARKRRDDFENAIKDKEDQKRRDINIKNLLEDEKESFERYGEWYDYKDLYKKSVALAAIQSAKDMIEYIKSEDFRKSLEEEGKSEQEIEEGIKSRIKNYNQDIKDLEYYIDSTKKSKLKKLAEGGELSIGDKVTIDENYGGGSGIVKDIMGSFVIVKTKEGNQSYHKSNLTLQEDDYEDEENYKKGGELDPDDEAVKSAMTHKAGAAGGLLVGKRHSEGGIKAVNKSTNSPIEMEGGEVVITRNAVSDNKKREFEGQMLTNREILSRINESGGGVSFASGGDVPSSCKCSGKSYKYGGKSLSDYDIINSMNTNIEE